MVFEDGIRVSRRHRNGCLERVGAWEEQLRLDNIYHVVVRDVVDQARHLRVTGGIVRVGRVGIILEPH